MRIEVDTDKCTGCGICKEICPKGAKIWDVNKKAMATNLKYCHLCTICAGKCPEQAIHIIRDEESNVNQNEDNENITQDDNNEKKNNEEKNL